MLRGDSKSFRGSLHRQLLEVLLKGVVGPVWGGLGFQSSDFRRFKVLNLRFFSVVMIQQIQVVRSWLFRA